MKSDSCNYSLTLSTTRIIVDLFSDEAIMEEIRDILENKRDINYRETYRVLKEYDTE